jgi:hypothetical protein
MRRALVLALTIGFFALSAHARAPTPSSTDPALLCRQAIQAAEREHRLPASLLSAIAKVESGRLDPRTGAVTPWPWTVNAEGQGRHYETKTEAIAAVEALRARGVRLIDVGCLQVNLHHHPAAFADLEQAFDPLVNARYAGLFLTRLHAAARDWVQAAGRYHSATPELGEAYRLKVLAAWPGMAHRLAEERQRSAMAAAWGATTRGTAASGRQAVQIGGLSLPPEVMLGRRIGPARQQTVRVGGRPQVMLELAEAPSWR